MSPGGRRQHTGVVPRTGGVAVLVGLAAGSWTAFALGAFPSAGAGPAAALPFVASTLIVFTLGLVDDARACPASVKLLVQSAAASLIVAAGYVTEFVTTPFGPVALSPAVGTAVTVVWLVGITNAVNLMDGLDGLVGGIGSILAVSLAIFAVITGDAASITVALVLCGACLGFLPYNWRPARIFLGDSGALTIGFVLAWLSLTASLKASTFVAVLVPYLVLGIPAIDTLYVMRVRVAEAPQVPTAGPRPRGAGGLSWGLSRMRRMVRGDRHHMHHSALLFAGQGAAVSMLYGVVALCCLLALAAAFRNSTYLAAGTLLVEVAAVALLRGLRPRERGAAAPGAGAGAQAANPPNPTSLFES